MQANIVETFGALEVTANGAEYRLHGQWVEIILWSERSTGDADTVQRYECCRVKMLLTEFGEGVVAAFNAWQSFLGSRH